MYSEISTGWPSQPESISPAGPWNMVKSAVTAIPDAIEATPPAGVTRFQRNAAKSAGVRPAPTIVYAVNAMARMEVNCVASMNETIPITTMDIR